MSITTLAVLAAEAGGHSEEGGINPWLVGGLAFGILVAALISLVAFAGGREHS